MIKKWERKCSDSALNLLQLAGFDFDAEFQGSELKRIVLRLPESGDLLLDGGGYGGLYFSVPEKEEEVKGEQ